MLPYLDLRGGPSICTSLFLIKNGRLLVGLRHYKAGAMTTTAQSVWTTPGGRCNEGESIGENLLRETKEETGIVDIKLVSFIGVVPGARRGDTLYAYTGSTQAEPELMEPDKFSEWRWADPSRIPGAFINPAALARFLAYRDRPHD